MNTLKFLVAKKKAASGLSAEKLAYQAGLSRNQFSLIVEGGFTDGTSLKAVRGIAKVLDMEDWQLLKLISEESDQNSS